MLSHIIATSYGSGRKLKLDLTLKMKINTFMLLLHLMIGNFVHKKVQATKNTKLEMYTPIHILEQSPPGYMQTITR